jgi:hypothetical protein
MISMLSLNKKWNETKETGHQKELPKKYIGLREEVKCSCLEFPLGIDQSGMDLRVY